MSTEVRPFGVTCNIQCQYCYQNPQRDAGNMLRAYDLDRMKAGIEVEGGPFTLFGGEPLLMPKPDLEALWSWGFERFGSNSLQTNGTLIDDDHISLFHRYNVYVGISIDGPGPLNDVRWAGSSERTRELTAKTERAIERLCEAGISPGVIVTLSRCNAAAGRLPLLHTWLRWLEAIGVTTVRAHVLEVETGAVQRTYALSPLENLTVMRSLAALERQLTTLHLDVFTDMRNLLRGQDRAATCVWTGCDPYTTAAVRGVEGSGQRSNCGRTNKLGIDFVKADNHGFERYLALYQTPQEYGGCRDCRFFLMCKGQCPGTALDGDWRNRSEHCDLWKGLFRDLEETMLDHGEQPLSASPLRSRVEAAFVRAWREGQNTTIQDVLDRLRHGDETAPAAALHASHGDTPHGDAPHGDSRAPVPLKAGSAPRHTAVAGAGSAR